MIGLLPRSFRSARPDVRARSEQTAQHRDEARCWSLAAALKADAGAFEEQKHFIRKDFRVAIARRAKHLDETVMLPLLVGFDHGASRMVGVELNGCISESAPALELIGEHVFDIIDPRAELFFRRARFFSKQAIENFDVFAGKLLHVGNDEVVL